MFGSFVAAVSSGAWTEVTPAVAPATGAVPVVASADSVAAATSAGELSSPALVFRATSLMKSVRTNATSAAGAAYRKTSATPWP